MDLTDPEFRQWSLMNSRATRAGFRALLADAIRAGELERCDTEGLARLIVAASRRYTRLRRSHQTNLGRFSTLGVIVL